MTFNQYRGIDRDESLCTNYFGMSKGNWGDEGWVGGRGVWYYKRSNLNHNIIQVRSDQGVQWYLNDGFLLLAQSMRVLPKYMSKSFH